MSIGEGKINMRCKICDFSPSNPGSTFRDGLVFPSGQNKVNMVVYNEATGTYMCPLCAPDELELRDYPEGEDIVDSDEFDDNLLEPEFDQL